MFGANSKNVQIRSCFSFQIFFFAVKKPDFNFLHLLAYNTGELLFFFTITENGEINELFCVFKISFKMAVIIKIIIKKFTLFQ